MTWGLEREKHKASGCLSCKPGALHPATGARKRQCLRRLPGTHVGEPQPAAFFQPLSDTIHWTACLRSAKRWPPGLRTLDNVSQATRACNRPRFGERKFTKYNLNIFSYLSNLKERLLHYWCKESIEWKYIFGDKANDSIWSILVSQAEMVGIIYYKKLRLTNSEKEKNCRLSFIVAYFLCIINNVIVPLPLWNW